MAMILGIDPGSRVTGFGIIKSDGDKIEYIDCGCVRTNSENMRARLKTIFDELYLSLIHI